MEEEEREGGRERERGREDFAAKYINTSIIQLRGIILIGQQLAVCR